MPPPPGIPPPPCIARVATPQTAFVCGVCGAGALFACGLWRKCGFAGEMSGGAPTVKALPKVIFGTATLGNLYAEPPWADKMAVIKAIVESAGDGIAVFDSAGKYGVLRSRWPACLLACAFFACVAGVDAWLWSSHTESHVSPSDRGCMARQALGWRWRFWARRWRS